MEPSLKGSRLAEDNKAEVIIVDGNVSMRETPEMDTFTSAFTNAIAKHRHWPREDKIEIPA